MRIDEGSRGRPVREIAPAEVLAVAAAEGVVERMSWAEFLRALD